MIFFPAATKHKMKGRTMKKEIIHEKLRKPEITLLAENTIKKELPKIITSELQTAWVQK